jgi:16S rRNA (uracil1498-N3)-methyltransferase
MSLKQFFLEAQVLSVQMQPSFRLDLSEEDFKHAKVARLVKGERIAVVDAANDYFECVINDISIDEITVSITTKEDSKEDVPSIVIVQGLAKGDKLDEVLRHATELGISGFVPLVCSRSVVKLDKKKTQNRMTRWASIAKSAAMQSGRRTIPSVHEPMRIRELSSLISKDDFLFICWEEAEITQSFSKAMLQIKSQLLNHKTLYIVIGPEGGLEKKEVDELLGTHAQSYLVSLGNTILRTETAGVVAPALALYELGKLGGKKL